MKNLVNNATTTNNEVEQKLEQEKVFFKILIASDITLAQLPESYQTVAYLMRAVHEGGSYLDLHVQEKVISAPRFRVVCEGNLQLFFQQFASEDEARKTAEAVLPPTAFRKVYEDDSNKNFLIVNEAGVSVDGITYENRNEAVVRLLAIANPGLLEKLEADRRREA